MKDKNLLEELKQIGFNEYKAKVFAVLSSGNIMSASEIVEQAKIVRGSVYDILKGFVAKGYCNEIETNRVLQYQIIDPDIILDKIVREYNEAHNSNIANLKSTFAKLKENYSTDGENESKFINIELIRGYNKHRISKYKELLESAEIEICGMYKFKGLVSDEADEVAVNFINKGGKIRSIYQIGLDFKIIKGEETFDATPEQLIEVCRKFESTGEEIRLTAKDIPNMTVVDDDKVFINTEDKWIPRQSQADIILRRSNFAKYMKDLFEFYWNESMTINEYKEKTSNKNHSTNSD
jgi:HTH-type transcriptional regulator, sugar sensing transcriptional regulator